jgi:hypothetical protein
MTDPTKNPIFSNKGGEKILISKTILKGADDGGWAEKWREEGL